MVVPRFCYYSHGLALHFCFEIDICLVRPITGLDAEQDIVNERKISSAQYIDIKVNLQTPSCPPSHYRTYALTMIPAM